MYILWQYHNMTNTTENLIPGKLYTILDEKVFVGYQHLEPATLLRTKFDTNKPILFLGLSVTTETLPTNTNPLEMTCYRFLINSMSSVCLL